jgi:hypothetical protein
MPPSRKRAAGLVGLSIAALAAAAGGPVSQASANTQSTITIITKCVNVKVCVPPPSQNQQGNNNLQDQSGAQTVNGQ